ncbi:peptidase U62 modulator of DNA gyrase [Desulfurococcaceae archaeon AG1]|jgi:PmbA protein|nr:peptidase U62 modulator of DNA gyrase [Desulfurococcaceae archaeon AG1]
MTNYVDIDIEKIYRRALDLGASEAEIYYSVSRDLSLNFSEDIERAEVVVSKSLGIRVSIGKKIAIVGTQDLSPRGIEDAVIKAISIARAAPEDPGWRGFNEKLGSVSKEGFADKAIASIGPEELVEIAVSTIEGVMSSSPSTKPVRGSCSASYHRVEIINPYGGPVSREETGSWVYVYAKASSDKGEGTYGDYHASRSIKDLRPHDLGVKVGSMAKSFIGGRAPENDVYDLILAPRIFASFIGVMLSPAISALAVQRGRSPLIGKINSRIAVEDLSIVDEGSDPRYLGARSFDDEGHPTSRNIIIEKGVLKSYIYDSYTAKIEGRASTGNAWRSYSSPPTPGPNHLSIQPGTSSIDEMIRSTKRGIYVLSTIGEWLSNPVSGNLNATITNAYLIENGEIVAPINGGVVSVDFYEMLMSKIYMLGKEVEHRERVSAPPVLLKSIRVAGK